MPHAGDEVRGVAFDLHAPAAAVAPLAALQFTIHIVKIHAQARGQPLKDCNQALTVRLAGSLETKHIGHDWRQRGILPRLLGF